MSEIFLKFVIYSINKMPSSLDYLRDEIQIKSTIRDSDNRLMDINKLLESVKH